MLTHLRFIFREMWALLKSPFVSRSFKQFNYHACRALYGGPREAIARVLSRLPPRPETDPSIDVRAELRLLETQGYALLEDLCPPDLAQRLFEQLEDVPCHDPYRPELGAMRGKELPPQTHVAHLERAALIRSKDVMDLANHPKVLAIVSRALNAKPTVLVTSWWSSYAGGTPEAAEFFHRDKDDWRFLKVFIYLTDVDRAHGPHVFVPGSHTHKGLEFRRQRRYSDDEVYAYYGKGSQVEFMGPAGTALIENTYGLHRGLPVMEGRRLMLQFTYSLFPLLYAPDAPEVNASDLAHRYDAHINRLHIGA